MTRLLGLVSAVVLMTRGLTALGSPAAPEELPAPPREFRGVWVASVSNIDWPSKPGLSTEQQQKDLLDILRKCQELRLNAVVLQVRPMCDALYPSKLEPWSEFLTGQAGKAADWDPLAFAVEEAHKRGIELHAWFNPYRARHPSAKTEPPADHLVKKRPDLAKVYGKHHWLNPTSKEVQDHSLAVILDVVTRYDLDGIHVDDYFYPYPEPDENMQEIPFPDDDTWAVYQKAGGKLTRPDWRRDAVNQFIRRMYTETKKAKPWVKVGISPFGIWKPGFPAGIEGFNQYEKLYADAKLWLNEGWVDYWTPQLYWPIAQEKQSYPKLLAWWAGENTKGRHLWPGNYTSRVTGEAKGWPASEVGDQIAATRKQPGATGNVHFSMKAFLKNSGGVADEVKKMYAEPALVPATPWLGDKKPGKPMLSWGPSNDLGRLLQVETPDGEPIRQYVIRLRFKDRWLTDVRSATSGFARDDGKYTVFDRVVDDAAEVVVTAVSRTGIEGEPARLKV